MVFLVGWVLVLLLLAGWSALVWAGHAVLAAMLSHVGTLGPGEWSLPESLMHWLPVWAAEWLVGTLENWTPQLQSLANSLPSVSSGVTLLAWVVWGGGALALLVVGIVIHVGVALWRKSKASTPAVTALR